MSAYRDVTADAQPVRLEIARGYGARLRHARGTLITVQDGSVWITQHGSAEDVCLDAGESFRIERDGLTLLTAIEPDPLARVTLAPAQPLPPALARLAARLARWWGGLPEAAPRRSAV